jgi:hypothetical protein
MYTVKLPGLSRGCFDLFSSNSHWPTHIKVYRGSALPKKVIISATSFFLQLLNAVLPLRLNQHWSLFLCRFSSQIKFELSNWKQYVNSCCLINGCSTKFCNRCQTLMLNERNTSNFQGKIVYLTCTNVWKGGLKHRLFFGGSVADVWVNISWRRRGIKASGRVVWKKY